MSFQRTKFTRLSLLYVTAFCASIAFSSCSVATNSSVSNPESASTAKPTSETAAATAEPSSVAITGVPLEDSCEKLLDPEAIYKINPNYAFAGEEQTPAGPQAELISQLQGKTCKYVNTSGGAEIFVSVAQVTSGSSPLIINKINELGLAQVDVYGQSSEIQSYFATVDGVGIGIGYENRFVVVASSTLFSQPTDPSAFIMGSLNALR